jgi:hypothetical protein
MDAGKIMSTLPNLRPGDGGGRGASAQGDAAFAARVAAAVLLDSVLHAADSEPNADPLAAPPGPVPPRSGVVVNLSAAVLAAEAASRVATALPHTASRTHPNAEPATSPAPAQVYSVTERLLESGRTGLAAIAPSPVPPGEDRRSANTATPSIIALAPQIQTRTDVPAFVPPPSTATSRIEEHRSTAAAAIEQARDSERLAGLNARGETQVSSRRLRFEHVVIGAIVLGLALVLLL